MEDLNDQTKENLPRSGLLEHPAQPLNDQADMTKYLESRLKAYVMILGAEIGERNIWHPDRLKQTEEIIVIGGHYDSVRGSPGADDNGSGVAP